MRLVVLIACLGVVTTAVAGRPDIVQKSPGPVVDGDFTLHRNDDVPLTLGNTSADPDAKLIWDTSGTDQLQIWLTDCDGGGTDCVLLYWLTGTSTAVFSGALEFDTRLHFSTTPGAGTLLLKSSGATLLVRNGTDTYYMDMIVDDVMVNNRLNIGAGTEFDDNATDGTLVVTNNAATQGVALITSTDGRAAFTDESLGTLTAGFGPATTKGAGTWVLTQTESVTFASDPGAASAVTTGGVIPAGAFVTAVTGRVTTQNTGGCTSMDVGIAAVDTDAFADGVAVTLNTTFDNTDANAAKDYSAASLGIIPNGAAQEITVTAVGGDGNCDDLVVALTVHYIGATAATDN